MLTPKIAVVAVIFALLPIPSALAQADQSGAPLGHPPNPRDCMPSPGNNDPSPTDPKTNPPLSAQASPSAGVICPPPGIDPAISVPPTGGGRTPVIPAPGTPGGDPNVQPK